MKVKTSVTLPADLIKAIDRAGRKGEARSRTLERLVREGLAVRARLDIEARDTALINQHADALNAEAEDVLAYQADV